MDNRKIILIFVSQTNKNTMKNLELILEDIELADSNTHNTFNVYYDADTKLMHAFENDAKLLPKQYVYRLTCEQDYIAKKYRQEILEYRLCKVTPEDEVCLGDIFMYGQFNQKI